MVTYVVCDRGYGTRTALEVDMATMMDKAMGLLGINAEDKDAETKVRTWMWHLGIRQVCSRCGGGGHYSYCQMYGTKCFKCRGKGEVGAKLTKVTMAQLQAKVEAGECDKLRAHWTALRAAKARLAGMAETAKEIYNVVGGYYSHPDIRRMDASAVVASPLFRAQGMVNACYYGMEGRGSDRNVCVSNILSDVAYGRRTDYLQCEVDMEACIQALRIVVEAWTGFEVDQ